MATNFPGGLDTFPTASQLRLELLSTSPHSTLHGDLGAALAAVEARVGVTGSADTVSLEYRVGHVPASSLALVDDTSGDVSTSRHGFAPRSPGVAGVFLDGFGAYSAAPGANPYAAVLRATFL